MANEIHRTNNFYAAYYRLSLFKHRRSVWAVVTEGYKRLVIREPKVLFRAKALKTCANLEYSKVRSKAALKSRNSVLIGLLHLIVLTKRTQRVIIGNQNIRAFTSITLIPL